MGKTRKGVYLDLEETSYKYRVGEYTFYFSSELYRDKFVRTYKSFMFYEALKFKNKYKMEVADTTFFLFTLYGKIEKRGYKITKNNPSGRPVRVIKDYPILIINLA